MKRTRRLRREQTAAEGWKWRRQAPLGSFIVDFLCLEAALAIELDGGVHAEQAERDARRDACLAKRGLSVLRFWNRELEEDFDPHAACALGRTAV